MRCLYHCYALYFCHPQFEGLQLMKGKALPEIFLLQAMIVPRWILGYSSSWKSCKSCVFGLAFCHTSITDFRALTRFMFTFEAEIFRSILLNCRHFPLLGELQYILIWDMPAVVNDSVVALHKWKVFSTTVFWKFNFLFCNCILTAIHVIFIGNIRLIYWTSRNSSLFRLSLERRRSSFATTLSHHLLYLQVLCSILLSFQSSDFLRSVFCSPLFCLEYLETIQFYYLEIYLLKGSVRAIQFRRGRIILYCKLRSIFEWYTEFVWNNDAFRLEWS